MKIPRDAIKKKVFELFLKNSRLKFSDIEKKIKINEAKIRSNLLTFHIKALINEKIIEKVGEFYKLTKESEKIIPFYKHVFEGNLKLPVVLIAIKQKDKLLLLKREERPYKGYFSLLGKRMNISESIEEAALRCAKEELALEVKFKKLAGVVHERLKEEGEFKHSFIFFVCVVEPVAKNFTKSKETLWVELSNPKGKIIPSDIWMIKNLISKKANVHELIMEEKDEELFF